eukprot:CAMPEP_0197629618 /NCGR_PEP_ID=MMETSP1338-20131121/7395_1 /TAXON_ID=43686 ORGANISM="Pelagodinium beii, Strain RCC1491" /NCGR_SAMPLE_ID=MMETSP1338 /ASSEMBLY_ACC=CAM_ASM_000754 /LENGTH=527 /DNA_ID=CAMNT_0043200687 /DNA_START=177 /DNA_END=1757 /DNA_ORIENTATION=+
MSQLQKPLKFDEDGEFLKTFLVDNDIALIRVDFILSLAASDQLLPRRQDVPEECQLSGPAIKTYEFSTDKRCDWVKHGDSRGWKDDWKLTPRSQMTSRLFVVSHPWHTAEHPDPKGSRLKELGKKLEKLHADSQDFVFIDWASLYQTDPLHEDYNYKKKGGGLPEGHRALRNSEQESKVKNAIEGMDRVLASGISHVVVFQTIHDVGEVQGLTVNKRPWSERGWCQWELYIAASFGRLADPENAMSMPENILHPTEYRKKAPNYFINKSDAQPLIEMYTSCYYASQYPDYLRALRNATVEGHVDGIKGALSSLDYGVGLQLIAALLAAETVKPFAADIVHNFIGTHHDNRGYDSVMAALLSVKGDPVAVTALCQKLDAQASPKVAEVVLDTLSKVADKGCPIGVPGLLRVLESDYSPWVKQRTVLILTQLAAPGDEATVAGLLQLLAPKNEKEAAVVRQIPRPKGRSSEPQKVSTEDIAEVSMRSHAAEVLGEIADPDDKAVLAALALLRADIKQAAVSASATSGLH